MDLFSQKRILLLGGTGYLGTLLVKELLKQDVDKIYIISRDEYKQFVFKESELKNNSKVKLVIGDIRNENSIKPYFCDIDYAFNLAAMKHVLICEENPLQAICTNVLGTENIARCAMEMGTKNVIQISSDKAIEAISTYGATKLLAEKIIHFSSTMNTNTSFSAARLVNILGSRGSVLEKWKSQIENSRSITITNPNMIRYFISSKEAVHFLFQICKYAENGMLFIPIFHKIRIYDLCTAFIDYMHDKYNIDKSNVHIEVTGMCDVEKLEESIFVPYELKKNIEIKNNMYSINLAENTNEIFDIMATNSLNLSEIRTLLDDVGI